MKKLVFDQAEGIVYRPPTEAHSFILRVTTGCSHNACTFCDMYRQVNFCIRSEQDIRQQIEQAARHKPGIKRVFLADGNALVLSTEKLLQILALLSQAFPNLTRVTCYASAKDIIRKTPAELTALKDAKLKLFYMGIESGDDQVLTAINKGATAAEMVAAGQRAAVAGIKLSVSIMLGLGGKERTTAHALNTARAITQINPNMLGILTTTLLEGTPLAEAAQRGQFNHLNQKEMLAELKLMLEHINVPGPCVFDTTHPFNLLPQRGVLPKDKPLLLSEIDEVISVQ
ncbi:radical SAM protein [Peptococcaceae bacterium 1198_IL3148]